MLNGIDISHHNSTMVFSNRISLNDYDFVIMKATEGHGFIDTCFKQYSDKISPNVVRGYYHFARPDLTPSPSLEAMHFMKTINTLGEDALLVLDWEAKALKYPITWALLWLKTVEQYYGKKPLIYCSESYVKNLKLIKNNNNGLWVAKYSKNNSKPNVKPYRHYALWQYTSTPFDKNVFNGNLEQLKKYCKRTKGFNDSYYNMIRKYGNNG